MCSIKSNRPVDHVLLKNGKRSLIKRAGTVGEKWLPSQICLFFYLLLHAFPTSHLLFCPLNQFHLSHIVTWKCLTSPSQFQQHLLVPLPRTLHPPVWHFNPFRFLPQRSSLDLGWGVRCKISKRILIPSGHLRSFRSDLRAIEKTTSTLVASVSIPPIATDSGVSVLYLKLRESYDPPLGKSGLEALTRCPILQYNYQGGRSCL